jgi:phosphoenolpyruvate carboxykinase (ATP)
MYYFLSGYTAKVAGTERGVTEPQATFSACFGAVFLVWHPTKYARDARREAARARLARVARQHGWSGGAYGTGSRMKLAYTRAMVRAALSGALDAGRDARGPGVRARRADARGRRPGRVLDARGTWADAAAYDAQAAKLAGMFRANIEKFGGAVSAEVKAAGPRA